MLTRSSLKMAVGAFMMLACSAAYAQSNTDGSIRSAPKKSVNAAFDIVHTQVTTEGEKLIFRQDVRGKVGQSKPKAHGQLAGAPVYSYVWPTNLNSSAAGFEPDAGILALAVTIHPDFDDTPLYDENKDGNKTNDGAKWHAHWIVLAKDEACGAGGLKVKDIAEGTTPKLPETWPNLPIFISSPKYNVDMKNSSVVVRVPLADIGFPKNFNFDGVTSALRVNQQVHAPLLCITDVWKIGSGDLSLPGKSQ